MMRQRRQVAVIGAGWAGLAAAVQATQRGHAVTLFEMASQAGGRARRAGTDRNGFDYDNGQHILIGAYAQTLRLMRTVGLDPEALLLRLPLRLVDAQGVGLKLTAGRPLPAFVRAVLTAGQWSSSERIRLMMAAGRWLAGGFRCAADQSVDDLAAGIGPQVRAELIEPLCVAALNTPSARASGQVFLRVLRDALFSAPGASDLLLPRTDLSGLLPEAGVRWLVAHGATWVPRHRVHALVADGAGVAVDGTRFDAVVLAASALESARLARALAPAWAQRAEGMRHEPIVTVWMRWPGLQLPEPMLALRTGDEAPAQFVFDLGRLQPERRGSSGLLAFVISGAADWVAAGQDATARAVLEQARRQGGQAMTAEPELVHVVAQRRATFACSPGLDRPPMRVTRSLLAAGDHVEGPYPATLEGAVRSGLAAADALGED